MGGARLSVWVALSLLCTAPVFAQETEDALLNRCFALQGAGRLPQALAQCQAAVRISRTGRSLALLGTTELRMERWVDAAMHISEAMEDRNHPRVRSQLPVLERAMVLIRPHVAELVIETTESDATVTIAGGEPLSLPRATPIYTAPGTVELIARSGRGEVVRRSLTLAAGQAMRIPLVFPREPVASPSPPPAPEQTARTETPGRQPQERSAVADSAPGSLQRALGWVAVAGGVAGLGLALGAWRAHEGTVGEYNDQCPAVTTNASTVAECGSRRPQAESDASMWQTISLAGLVSGGALAIGAVVLFATAPSSRPTGRVSLRCSAGPGTLGVQCGMNF